MSQMVICDHTGMSEMCSSCEHSKPHEVIVYKSQKCTHLTECVDYDDNATVVRCVKIKKGESK